MSKRTCLAVVLAVAVSALSGCVPTRLVTRIGARGTVIDARTRRPLARIVVHVEGPPTVPDTPFAGSTTWSNERGAFFVPAETRLRPVSWHFRRTWPDARSVLTISRAGYAPRRLELRTRLINTEEGAVINVGTVALRPAGR